MPVYQLDIQKQSGPDNFWTNIYHVQQTGLDVNSTFVDAIIAAEMAIHTNYVGFVSARMKLPGSTFGISAIRPLSGTGQAPDTGGGPLAPFNVVRVDFGQALGLPSRKYLRTYMREGDVTGDTLTSAYKSLVENSYAGPMIDIAGFVTETGADLLTFSVAGAVAMRQLRRGSKRKTQPVIPLA